MNPLCRNGWHKFKARYDERIDPRLIPSSGRGDLSDVLRAAKVKTYIHDICPRCGTTAQRS